MGQDKSTEGSSDRWLCRVVVRACREEGTTEAFPWGAWQRDAAAGTRKQAGRQSTALTRVSSCSGHVTQRFRILATLKQRNENMYSNTSG